ncbi:ABC transporter ATP-binding protein, partial [Achromobacter ruhlandii]
MSALLEVRDLGVSAAHGGPAVVRGVSYTVNRNEILCVVGESGSGKSVTAQAIMGLLPPDQLRVTQGRILYDGRDLVGLSAAEWQGLRGRKFGMVFQEPMTALNPVMRVGRQVEEVLAWHTDMDADARRQRVLELFGQVLLPDPRAMYAAFPFQLSGGQRPHVVTAVAPALRPDSLLRHAPTPALHSPPPARPPHRVTDRP